MAKQVRDPATGCRLAHTHQVRKRGEQGVEWTGVASDEAAYVMGAFLCPAPLGGGAMLRSGDYIVLSVFLFPAPVADQGEGQTVAGIDVRTVSPASVDGEREGQVFIDWPVVQRQV